MPTNLITKGAEKLHAAIITLSHKLHHAGWEDADDVIERPGNHERAPLPAPCSRIAGHVLQGCLQGRATVTLKGEDRTSILVTQEWFDSI